MMSKKEIQELAEAIAERLKKEQEQGLQEFYTEKEISKIWKCSLKTAQKYLKSVPATYIGDRMKRFKVQDIKQIFTEI